MKDLIRKGKSDKELKALFASEKPDMNFKIDLADGPFKDRLTVILENTEWEVSDGEKAVFFCTFRVYLDGTYLGKYFAKGYGTCEVNVDKHFSATRYEPEEFSGTYSADFDSIEDWDLGDDASGRLKTVFDDTDEMSANSFWEEVSDIIYDNEFDALQSAVDLEDVEFG